MTPEKSTRGIPKDCVGLAAAFRSFVVALYPESGGFGGIDASVDWPEFSDVLRGVDLAFREWLADSGPQAFARHPDSGDWEQLTREDWIIPANALNLGLGFNDDFVWHDDSDPVTDPGIAYGPAESFIGGALQKAFFESRRYHAVRVPVMADRHSI